MYYNKCYRTNCYFNNMVITVNFKSLKIKSRYEKNNAVTDDVINHGHYLIVGRRKHKLRRKVH